MLIKREVWYWNQWYQWTNNDKIFLFVKLLIGIVRGNCHYTYANINRLQNKTKCTFKVFLLSSYQISM